MSADPSAAPAHALWVELATRITTQRLHYRAGDEETAARSVASLFGTVRGLMAAHPEAQAFHGFALTLLNGTLRPNTARWHGWMTQVGDKVDGDGKPILKFRDEWVRRKFREELRTLQPRVLGFQKTFEAMSLGRAADARWLEPERHPEVLAELTAECRSASGDASPGAPLPLCLRSQVRLRAARGTGRGEEDIAPAIVEAESAAIRRRRATFAPGTVPPPGAAVMNATGLALSGGGIRSATFCLGVVQTLQRHGLFAQFDYLSTVSGGGYLGSFISCYLGADPAQLEEVEKKVAADCGKAMSWQTTAQRVTSPPPEADAARQRLAETFRTPESGGSESAALRHLRNHSRYLLHGGAWGLVRIVGVLLTGFFTSLLMLLTIPLLAAWVVAGFRHPPLDNIPAALGWRALAGLAGLWLVLPLTQRMAHGMKWDSIAARVRNLIEFLALLTGVAALGLGALWAAPGLVRGYEWLGKSAIVLLNQLIAWKPPELLAAALASFIPAIFGSLMKRPDGSVRPWAQWLFALSAPAFFLFAFLIFASNLGVGGNARWPLHYAAIGSGAVLLWAWLFLNINTFAPHNYYRDRLCECYLAMFGRQQRTSLQRWIDRFFHGVPDTGSTEIIDGVGTLQRLPLTALGASVAAPYHLINTTLNAAASKNPSLRGRNGDFFVFSRHFCGSPLTGYLATEDLEKVDPHVDLGTAMALSGAAASTNMGWQTQRRMRFVMALFNVRLGYWLRRPGSTGWWRPFEGPGPLYFLRELCGAVHERTRYVNLSDGGHLENLAVYELLRRQCKFIVCVDAGMEPQMECADLMRLERYATIDLGIRMHFDPADLTLLPTNYSRAYAVLVKLDYAPASPAPQLGWMLYLKLAVTGTEPRYVLDYRREHPAFPHQTTGDQFYDEAQFEAYRALGECAAESLFREEILGPSATADLAAWFQALANSLLADNDEAFGVR